MVEWRDVVGFEDRYEVSSDGIVRSKDIELPCGFGRTRKKKGKILTPGEHYSGHLGVALSSSRKRIFTGIHRIVLSAFVRLPNNGEVARHKDGNCKNNKVENLEWGTPKENALDAIAHGVQPRGETCGKSSLKEEQVRGIRKAREGGLAYDEIAKVFKTSKYNVIHICRRETWKHVE